MSIRNARRQLVGLAIAVLAVGNGACHSDKSTGVSVLALTPDAGVNAQSGTVGQTLGTPISVHVTDANGNAMSGVLVSWSVLKGGSVDSSTSLTDAGGDAVTHWTLGTAAGIDSLEALVSDGVTTTITATANAGATASLTKVSGDVQNVTAGTAGQPFVVEVMDQYGNAVSGATVTWSTNGGGSLSAGSSTSDTDGLAQVTLTTAAPGTYTVTASSGSVTPVSFTLTAN
jgi:adhesin/invasin